LSYMFVDDRQTDRHTETRNRPPNPGGTVYNNVKHKCVEIQTVNKNGSRNIN